MSNVIFLSLVNFQARPIAATLSKSLRNKSLSTKICSRGIEMTVCMMYELQTSVECLPDMSDEPKAFAAGARKFSSEK